MKLASVAFAIGSATYTSALVIDKRQIMDPGVAAAAAANAGTSSLSYPVGPSLGSGAGVPPIVAPIAPIPPVNPVVPQPTTGYVETPGNPGPMVQQQAIYQQQLAYAQQQELAYRQMLQYQSQLQTSANQLSLYANTLTAIGRRR